MDWNEYYIDIAKTVSKKSKDTSVKVGAIIVRIDNGSIVSTGYNGFPRGVKDLDARWNTRPDKYNYVVHAEQNAILQAAHNGVSTKGCVLYLNFEPIPCNECVKAVVQAGICSVIGPNIPFAGSSSNPKKWSESFKISQRMLHEGNIACIEVNKDNGDVVLLNKKWSSMKW